MRRSLLAAAVFGAVLLVLVIRIPPPGGPPVARADAPADAPAEASIEQIFDELLSKYENMTYEQFTATLPPRRYLDKIDFDPTRAEYFDVVAQQLQLTEPELQNFKRHGFTAVDHGQAYSFGSAYYAIYTRDLPVLVTTDSILHALHKSYDDMLMELEQYLFVRTLDDVLSAVHDRIRRDGSRVNDRDLAIAWEDVDLYVTVARNLLVGAGSDRPPGRSQYVDGWDGSVLVASALRRDDAALVMLEYVKSLKLQNPFLGDTPTRIYGGERYVDYSQFQPRGHYTKSAVLKRYFRTLMWLGRADTGFNVLPPDLRSGLEVDAVRELRAAALLAHVLEETGGLDRLASMSEIIDFMIGGSDSLKMFDLADLLDEHGIRDADGLASSRRIDTLQKSIAASDLATQGIRSQFIASDPADPSKVPPPAIAQVFGQRYIIDSFVLAHVVFDSIIYGGDKMKRMMPRGLDVMAALGNPEAVPLLEDDLTKWNYAANLRASMDFVHTHSDEWWGSNLYSLWLDCLRQLDDDVANQPNMPQVMRTKTWQMKQLQTQLGSWAQLRHDTILYAKQSYSAGAMCQYPAGYVEPYPEFYARIQRFARTAADLFGAADYTGIERIQQRQVNYWKKLAQHSGRLEQLARKELNAEPFTEQETRFLKKTIDKRGGGSGGPRYDGWYPELFYYGGASAAQWDPTIADVHTDPNSKHVLEVGVGDTHFLVAAIDNEESRTVYVGPVFSYYEFRHPCEDRLTDEKWQTIIRSNDQPPRPDWADEFTSPTVARQLK